MSPSPTRRIVVHDTPTPTIDVVYKQQPSIPDNEFTASTQATIAQVITPATPHHAQAKSRRWPTMVVCMPPSCIRSCCPKGTLCVIFSPRCVNDPHTAQHPDLAPNFPIGALPNSKHSSLSENAHTYYSHFACYTLVLNVGHVRGPVPRLSAAANDNGRNGCDNEMMTTTIPR
jgi:hypothetical protein